MTLSRQTALAEAVAPWSDYVQQVETKFGPALNYTELTGQVFVGDTVLLNRTARLLNLGTGGFDFVIAIMGDVASAAEVSAGHIVKARYLPCQHAVLTLEEQPEYALVWEQRLDGYPVVAGQLHSQLAPAAFALWRSGLTVTYIMTGGAALNAHFSKLAANLRDRGVIAATITCGQTSGGDYETVTLHSALLAAKYIVRTDAVIVMQGPGNAGTGTKYGFSGIEQAEILNAAAALGGRGIAIPRMSDGDKRERHRGLSHHTVTSLELALEPCDIAIPAGVTVGNIPPRHRVVQVEGTDEVLAAMIEAGLSVTTMGRKIDEDRIYFSAAAAAGIHAAKLVADEDRIEPNARSH